MQSFDEFWAKYRPVLFGIARRLTHTQRGIEAEDLLQDAYIRLSENEDGWFLSEGESTEAEELKSLAFCKKRLKYLFGEQIKRGQTKILNDSDSHGDPERSQGPSEPLKISFQISEDLQVLLDKLLSLMPRIEDEDSASFMRLLQFKGKVRDKQRREIRDPTIEPQLEAFLENHFENHLNGLLKKKSLTMAELRRDPLDIYAIKKAHQEIVQKTLDLEPCSPEISFEAFVEPQNQRLQELTNDAVEELSNRVEDDMVRQLLLETIKIFLEDRIEEGTDQQVLETQVWILSNIYDCSNEKIAAILKIGRNRIHALCGAFQKDIRTFLNA